MVRIAFLRPAGSGDDGQRQHIDALAAFGDLGFHQRLDVLVIDMLLAVSEVLEAIEGILKRIVAQLKAQRSPAFL
jgi:hypothetical protein